MKTKFQQNHHILSLGRTDVNTYIINEKSKFMGELTLFSEDSSKVNFDYKGDKMIFEKTGCRKSVIKIYNSDDNSLKYSLSYSIRKNDELNILGKVSYETLDQIYMESIYWEWHIEFSGENIISYIQSIDSEDSYTIKINATEKIINELNILCAAGCFILLTNERNSNIQINAHLQNNQPFSYIEKISETQLSGY